MTHIIQSVWEEAPCRSKEPSRSSPAPTAASARHSRTRCSSGARRRSSPRGRDVATVSDGDPRLVPVQLDVTDADRVAAVARELGDVGLVVNDAGIGRQGTR